MRFTSALELAVEREREVAELRAAAERWASQLDYEASQPASAPEPAQLSRAAAVHVDLATARAAPSSHTSTVTALVLQVGPLRDVATKSGGTVCMGKILVGDASAQYCEIVMWRDVARRVVPAMRAGAVVELRGVRWALFNRTLSGTVGSTSALRVLGVVCSSKPADAVWRAMAEAERRLRSWARDSLRWEWPSAAAAAAMTAAPPAAPTQCSGAPVDVRDARASQCDTVLSIRAAIAEVAVVPAAAQRAPRVRVVLRDAPRRRAGDGGAASVESADGSAGGGGGGDEGGGAEESARRAMIVLSLWGEWTQPRRVESLRALMVGAAPVVVRR